MRSEDLSYRSRCKIDEHYSYFDTLRGMTTIYSLSYGFSCVCFERFCMPSYFRSGARSNAYHTADSYGKPYKFNTNGLRKGDQPFKLSTNGLRKIRRTLSSLNTPCAPGAQCIFTLEDSSTGAATTVETAPSGRECFVRCGLRLALEFSLGRSKPARVVETNELSTTGAVDKNGKQASTCVLSIVRLQYEQSIVSTYV